MWKRSQRQFGSVSMRHQIHMHFLIMPNGAIHPYHPGTGINFCLTPAQCSCSFTGRRSRPSGREKNVARKSAAFLGLSPKIDLAGVRAPRAGACAQKPNEEPAPTRERREKRASFTHDRDQAPRTCLATQHKQSQDRPRPNRQENRSALHALSAGELEATQFRRKR